MKHPDRLSSVFFIIFSAAICLTALKLPWGTLKNPGPMLFPMLLGVSLLALAVVLLLQSASARTSFLALFPKAEILKVLYLLLIFFGSIFVLEPLGFFISTFVLLTLLFKTIGGRGALKSILFGLTVSFITYWSFTHLLSVRLPRGVIWF